MVWATSEEFQDIMNWLNAVRETYGLRRNKRKTKIVISERAQNSQADIKNVTGYRTVNNSNHLGSLVSTQSGCEEENTETHYYG